MQVMLNKLFMQKKFSKRGLFFSSKVKEDVCSRFQSRPLFCVEAVE